MPRSLPWPRSAAHSLHQAWKAGPAPFLGPRRPFLPFPRKDRCVSPAVRDASAFIFALCPRKSWRAESLALATQFLRRRPGAGVVALRTNLLDSWVFLLYSGWTLSRLLSGGLTNQNDGCFAGAQRWASELPFLFELIHSAPHSGPRRERLRRRETRSRSSGLPSVPAPPPPPFHTRVCTQTKPEGAILTSASSGWEGREARGIPLVVWENESHLPLTCEGSTFPTPSGGHS